MATGTYLPLLDLVKVAVDPANVTDEDLIEVASHEHWHSLESCKCRMNSACW